MVLPSLDTVVTISRLVTISFPESGYSWSKVYLLVLKMDVLRSLQYEMLTLQIHTVFILSGEQRALLMLLCFRFSRLFYPSDRQHDPHLPGEEITRGWLGCWAVTSAFPDPTLQHGSYYLLFGNDEGFASELLRTACWLRTQVLELVGPCLDPSSTTHCCGSWIMTASCASLFTHPRTAPGKRTGMSRSVSPNAYLRDRICLLLISYGV